MEPIKAQLDKIRSRLPDYTPEQLEAARRKVAQQNSICRIDCPECGGIGYVKGEDGHVHTCPNVDPFILYSAARFGLEENERTAVWEDIDPVNNTQAAVAAVREAIQRGSGWVYLWGDYGIGKTLILKTAIAQALRGHHLAAYTRMVEVIDHLRGAYDAKSPSDESQARLEWWTRLPLLAIDEFDRVKNTEWASERRFLLMDKRYEQALRGDAVTIALAKRGE